MRPETVPILPGWSLLGVDNGHREAGEQDEAGKRQQHPSPEQIDERQQQRQGRGAEHRGQDEIAAAEPIRQWPAEEGADRTCSKEQKDIQLGLVQRKLVVFH